jgi:tetratricopeptide (TPR) repeat protein
MRLFFILFFGMIVFSTLCSCTEPHIGVAAANQEVRTGNFQIALRRYLHAEEVSAYGGLIRYNIGNVFYYLEEEESAFAAWKRAVESTLREVRYRGYFNMGVAYYREGKYEQAAEMFVLALRIYPESRDAKGNLEYAFREAEKIKMRSDTERRITLEEKVESGLPTKQAEGIVDIVSQQEQYIWQSRQTEETAGTPSRDW